MYLLICTIHRPSTPTASSPRRPNDTASAATSSPRASCTAGGKASATRSRSRPWPSSRRPSPCDASTRLTRAHRYVHMISHFQSITTNFSTAYVRPADDNNRRGPSATSWTPPRSTWRSCAASWPASRTPGTAGTATSSPRPAASRGTTSTPPWRPPSRRATWSATTRSCPPTARSWSRWARRSAVLRSLYACRLGGSAFLFFFFFLPLLHFSSFSKDKNIGLSTNPPPSPPLPMGLFFFPAMLISQVLTTADTNYLLPPGVPLPPSEEGGSDGGPSSPRTTSSRRPPTRCSGYWTTYHSEMRLFGVLRHSHIGRGKVWVVVVEIKPPQLSRLWHFRTRSPPTDEGEP